MRRGYGVRCVAIPPTISENIGGKAAEPQTRSKVPLTDPVHHLGSSNPKLQFNQYTPPTMNNDNRKKDSLHIPTMPCLTQA